MANVVNNLRVNGKEVKKIFFNGRPLKELWAPNKLKEVILIWKNANPFIFTQSIADVNLAEYGENTIIFEGFSPQYFYGSYSIVENAESEKPNLELGQMVVETTEGDE